MLDCWKAFDGVDYGAGAKQMKCVIIRNNGNPVSRRLVAVINKAARDPLDSHVTTERCNLDQLNHLFLSSKYVVMCQGWSY